MNNLNERNLLRVLRWSSLPHGSDWVRRQVNNFIRDRFAEVATEQAFGAMSASESRKTFLFIAASRHRRVAEIVGVANHRSVAVGFRQRFRVGHFEMCFEMGGAGAAEEDWREWWVALVLLSNAFSYLECCC